MKRNHRPPKVAFIGNMNNNHFAVVRFLRDEGLEVDLLLTNDGFDHFHPKSDTSSLNFQTYVHQLSWGDARSFLGTNARQIKSDLGQYGILFGCGLAPAYCAKASRSLDVFIPYGGDIWSSTRFQLVSPHLLPSVWCATYMQRKAISCCNVVQLDDSFEMYNRRIDKLCQNPSQGRWKFGVPMVYHPDYSDDKLQCLLSRTHWGHEFQDIRQNTELMLFSSVRHHWDGPKN